MSAKQSSKSKATKATKTTKTKTVKKTKEPGFDDFHLLGVKIDNRAKHTWRFALMGTQFAMLMLTLVTMVRFYRPIETTAVDIKFVEMALILNVVFLIVSAIAKRGHSFAIVTLLEILFFIICLITPVYTVVVEGTDPDCPQCEHVYMVEEKYNLYGIPPIGNVKE